MMDHDGKLLELEPAPLPKECEELYSTDTDGTEMNEQELRKFVKEVAREAGESVAKHLPSASATRPDAAEAIKAFQPVKDAPDLSEMDRRRSHNSNVDRC